MHRSDRVITPPSGLDGDDHLGGNNGGSSFQDWREVFSRALIRGQLQQRQTRPRPDPITRQSGLAMK